MSTPKTYRKKPVEIEAMQYDGTARGATPILDWIYAYDERAYYRCSTGSECSGDDAGHELIVATLEGEMLVSKGDFIIKGVQNEFYPCKPDIFAETYEEVPSDPDSERAD